MIINDGGGTKKKKNPRGGRSAKDEYTNPKPVAKDTGDRRGRTRGEYGPNKSKEKDPNDRSLVGSDRKRGKKRTTPKSTGPVDNSKSKKKVVSKPKKDKAVRKIKKKREKTNPPAPAKTAVKTEPSKTYSVTNLTGFQNQEQELLNAYIAMAGTELFQYINSQTIDGAYNDVAIINVLSRRRQQYTPNRLIELAQVYVKAMWIENGELCIQIDDPDDKWDRCVLSLLVGTSSSIIAKTVN